MKRKITFLIAAVMLLDLIVHPISMMGQSYSKVYTLTPAASNASGSTDYDKSVDITISGITWNPKANTSSTTWFVGGKKSTLNSSTGTADREIYSKTDITDNVSRIVIYHGTKDSDITVNSVTVTVHNSAANASTGESAVATFTRDFVVNDSIVIVKTDNTSWAGKFYRIVYNVTNTQTSNKKFQFTKAIFYKTVNTGPSITASDVTLKASDTSGEISYSVSNPVTGGEMTAAEKTAISWIDEVAVDAENSKVTFTATENTTGEERSGIITLTYSNDSKTTVTKDVTVTQKRYRHITYNGNENTGGTAPVDDNNYDENDEATVLGKGTLVKTGKAFKEWNTEADETGESYAPGATLTMPDEDVVLYAIWADAYTLTYNANGGEGTMTDTNSPYGSGATVTTLPNTFTAPSGKVFARWNTEDGGEGDEYIPGETFTITANTTLYAQWADPCTITLISNGMSYNVTAPKNYAYALSAPENVPTGYTYAGWSTKTTTIISNDVKTTYTPTGDVTLNAVFVETGSVSGYQLIESLGSISAGTYLFGAYSSASTPNPLVYRMAKSSMSSGDWEVTDTKQPTDGVYSSVPTGASEFVLTGDNTNGFTISCEINSVVNYLGCSDLTANRKLALGSYSSYKWFFAIMQNNITPFFNSYNFYMELKGDDYYYIVDNGTNSSTTLRGYQANDNSGNKYGRGFYLFKKLDPTYYTSIDNPTISGDVEITTPTTISSSQTFSGDLDITETLTIGGSAVVTVEGDITNSSAANLVIEDGGQLITSSSVQLTYKKGITSAAKDGGWYTISTPVHTASNTFLEHESVENMILTPATNYDLFYYDETTHYWMNYKQAEFDLNVGQGYLYRNNGAELHFAGYNNQATSYNVALSYASTENKLLGFNLIGNPYPQNITMSDVTVNNGGTLSGGYVLSKDGAWSADVAATIAPAQGFLVQIDKTGVTATITKPTGGSKSRANNDYIKFIVANSQHEDAAFALFEEGYGLNKIDHRNSDIPMLYIPKEGHNFAIATMDDNTQSFNLNLKAKTTGKYTLTYKATGNYSYLHVIDRLTGEDVDMLMEGEYSFIASPSDAENRFIVRLEYSNGYENSEDSIFAYQSGSDIIVNGEGELQIFDVMGRRILTQYVSGVETINLQSHGVYIFKLNEKTQKIVVR